MISTRHVRLYFSSGLWSSNFCFPVTVWPTIISSHLNLRRLSPPPVRQLTTDVIITPPTHSLFVAVQDTAVFQVKRPEILAHVTQYLPQGFTTKISLPTFKTILPILLLYYIWKVRKMKHFPFVTAIILLYTIQRIKLLPNLSQLIFCPLTLHYNTLVIQKKMYYWELSSLKHSNKLIGHSKGFIF